MTKYKVNINRPDISNDEIINRKEKDFTVVLNKYKREKRKYLKVNWAILYLLILIILVTVFLAVRIIKNNEKKGSKGFIRNSVEMNK
jgi:hypothetical protein